MTVEGRLEVTTGRGPRTYVIGARTEPKHEPPMLDWRTSPLAEVFFRHAPGESYELETGVTGTVVARSLVRDGQDVAVELALPPPVPPRMPAAIVLDAEQQRAVELPEDVSLVVDGEAGVGKTLVALYRVQFLTRSTQKRFRALVLVPTEGLRRLVRMLADRMDLVVDVAVVDDWLVERARKAFPGLPKRTSDSATAQVIALKRNPAVRVVLDEFVGWKQPKDDDKLPRSRARLLHLFGDKDRLDRIVAAGGLEARAVPQTMAHTRAQFMATTEKAMRDVDVERLVALDGRAIDAGTPAEDAHTFDPEDAPVLFELARRGALPLPKLPRYDHIVIDEAQLRAPMELAAIADALVPGGTVTLDGDHRQATDESAYFAGWAGARSELRRKKWHETTLAVTYRSVPAIAEVARAIADGAPLPARPPQVLQTTHDGALAQATALAWHLGALTARDPWRQVAIVGRTPEHARRLHAELRGVEATLVLDGDFEFTPGVIVTTAAAVAGLEFDAVVIPDFTPAFWPASLARSLYVAVTRARDFLWLATPT